MIKKMIPKRRLAWKIYAIVCAAQTIYRILIGGGELLNLPIILFSVIGSIGLLGYAFERPVSRRESWQTYACIILILYGIIISILLAGFFLLFFDKPLSDVFKLSDGLGWFLSVTYLLDMTLYVLALYMYAYRSKDIWGRKKQNISEQSKLLLFSLKNF